MKKYLIIATILLCSSFIVAHYGNFDLNNCHEENGETHCHTSDSTVYYFDSDVQKPQKRKPSSTKSTSKESQVSEEEKCNTMTGENCFE